MSAVIAPAATTPTHLLPPGLSDADVLQRRTQYGPNQLPVEKSTPAWVILLNQLKSPLVYIILAAAGVSLALGEYGDFFIIMTVVVIDVVLGFIQEYQAQRTYTAMKGLLKPTTTVLREGDRVGSVIEFLTRIGRKLDQLVQANITSDQCVRVTGADGAQTWMPVAKLARPCPPCCPDP